MYLLCSAGVIKGGKEAWGWERRQESGGREVGIWMQPQRICNSKFSQQTMNNENVN
jgi:hypothetical protein